MDCGLDARRCRLFTERATGANCARRHPGDPSVCEYGRAGPPPVSPFRADPIRLPHAALVLVRRRTVSSLAVIRIGIDPMVHLGPVTLAWHGLTIAIGVLIGGFVAGIEARARGLDPDRLQVMG